MSTRPDVRTTTEARDAAVIQRPSLLARIDNTGVPLMLFRLVVGGMLLYTGVSKMVKPPADFLKAIHLYDMVPEGEFLLMNTIAVVMPYVEVVVGLLLVLGIALRGSALLTLLMLTGFTLAIGIRAVNMQAETAQPFCKIAFDCGCGTGAQIICHKLLENAGLIGLTLMILLTRTGRWCLKRDLVPREA